jgi:NAD(P)-dependent dehydrogenase (short-subunit alcohol dehydrogenase family)
MSAGMRSGSKSLEGRTALITGGGTVLGRAIALALSARGVRIVVTGRDEKALGETVGEVVYQGGKARHLAGEPGDTAHLAAAVSVRRASSARSTSSWSPTPTPPRSR